MSSNGQAQHPQDRPRDRQHPRAAARHQPTDPNDRAAAPKTSRSRRKADVRRSRGDAIRTRDRGDPDASRRRDRDGRSGCEPTRDEDQPRTPAPSFTTVAEVAAIELSHDQIAERAYHFYLERDRQPGDPFADWLTAERELRERFVGA